MTVPEKRCTPFDSWLWQWPDEARTALRETLRTPLFASIIGILRRC
jgi:hypothetical protein